MRTVSPIWMPILLFCSDLPHPFFLHIFYLVGFLSPVMLGCVGWVISSKLEGRNCKKCEQDGREGRANTCEAGRSSCDWLGNEWTFEREVIRKVEPNSVHSRRTRVSGYRLEQGSFWLDVKGEKPAGECFEVLKRAQGDVGFHPWGFWDSVRKSFEQPDPALKSALQAVGRGDLQRSLPD